MKKTTKQKQARSPGIRRVIADMQRREDAERAERRRRLTNGLARALLHLNDNEMSAIEPVIYGAIGRSIVDR